MLAALSLGLPKPKGLSSAASLSAAEPAAAPMGMTCADVFARKHVQEAIPSAKWCYELKHKEVEGGCNGWYARGMGQNTDMAKLCREPDADSKEGRCKAGTSVACPDAELEKMALSAKANILVAANAEMAAKAWVAPTPHEAATTLLGRVQLLESVASMEAAGHPVAPSDYGLLAESHACHEYLQSADCDWIEQYACPGSKPGSSGFASPDSSDAFSCCCQPATILLKEKASGWPEGEICVHKGELVQYGRARDGIQDFTVSDYGGEHAFSVQQKAAPWPTENETEWRPELLLSWFPGQANLHHFVGETVYPLWSMVQGTDAASTHSSQVAIMGTQLLTDQVYSDANWRSSNFTALLGLLPISNELLLPDGGSAMLNEVLLAQQRVLLASMPQWWQRKAAELMQSQAPATALLQTDESQMDEMREKLAQRAAAHRKNVVGGEKPPVCFRSSRQQSANPDGAQGLPRAFYSALAQGSRVCQAPHRGNGVEVLILHGEDRRHFINAEEVAVALRSVKGVARVQILELETMDAPDVLHQISAACGAHLMVALHGPSNELAHFLNGASHKAAGLLEIISSEGDICYYASRMKMGDSEMKSDCQKHDRANVRAEPTMDDIHVEVSAISQKVESMVALLAS